MGNHNQIGVLHQNSKISSIPMTTLQKHVKEANVNKSSFNCDARSVQSIPNSKKNVPKAGATRSFISRYPLQCEKGNDHQRCMLSCQGCLSHIVLFYYLPLFSHNLYHLKTVYSLLL